ncbi:unnamed protein product [uncultured virus]|nr:unnamed protein product [uncultured virus]
MKTFDANKGDFDCLCEDDLIAIDLTICAGVD